MDALQQEEVIPFPVDRKLSGVEDFGRLMNQLPRISFDPTACPAAAVVQALPAAFAARAL
jgi:hypothetical protein